MVSRGKPSQAIAGLRPLHGFTYRFRNARRSRSYGADEQLYEMLSHAKSRADSAALGGLKDFFFAGVDARTEAPRLGAEIDVETQALISLSEAVQGQITDRPVTTGTGGPTRRCTRRRPICWRTTCSGCCTTGTSSRVRSSSTT